MKTDTTDKILEYIKEKGQVKPKDIINYIGFGAPAVFRQLKKLISEGKIEKSGTPPMVYYHFPIDIKDIEVNEKKIFDIKINLKEFGIHLSDRESAKRSLLFIKMRYKKIIDNVNKIEINFEDIKVLGPGWADEFISNLSKEYPGKIVLLPSNNASIKASLQFINIK
ncbi:MAG: DUF4325 domain-containing protein [Candidatus Magasanikiibacteriota bacterium]